VIKHLISKTKDILKNKTERKQRGIDLTLELLGSQPHYSTKKSRKQREESGSKTQMATWIWSRMLMLGRLCT